MNIMMRNCSVIFKKPDFDIYGYDKPSPLAHFCVSHILRNSINKEKSSTEIEERFNFSKRYHLLSSIFNRGDFVVNANYILYRYQGVAPYWGTLFGV